jgi:hypothetical protein
LSPIPFLPGDFLLSTLNIAALRSSSVICASIVSLCSSDRRPYPACISSLMLCSSTCMGTYTRRILSLKQHTMYLIDVYFSMFWFCTAGFLSVSFAVSS